MNSITKAATSGSSSVPNSDIKSLLDGWIEAERNGVQFPVPFDLAWGIAGYSLKHHAKRRLTSKTSRLVENRDYLTTSGESSQAGRSRDSIQLTCDAFKQFCLLAETEEGDAIRQYFIEAEKNWRIVQQIAPQFAQDVELLRIQAQESLVARQIQLAQAEQQKAQAEQNLINTRHLIVSTCSEPVQQKIFGYTEIIKVEYRDRVVKDSIVINDGSTINKTQICQRYSILTKNGKPDFKRLNALLDKLNLPQSAWEETDIVQTNRELKRDYLDELDRALYTADERQMWLGESA